METTPDPKHEQGKLDTTKPAVAPLSNILIALSPMLLVASGVQLGGQHLDQAEMLASAAYLLLLAGLVARLAESAGLGVPYFRDIINMNRTRWLAVTILLFVLAPLALILGHGMYPWAIWLANTTIICLVLVALGHAWSGKGT